MRKRIPFDSPLPSGLAANPAVSALSYVYAAAVGARNFAYDKFPELLSRDLGRPVISIGGIRAGGVGKTPVAQMIGRYVVDKCGCGVAFLSRGYGRKRVSKRIVIVPPRAEVSWEEVGDEPWMLRSNIPESWLGIGADRLSVAKKLSPFLPSRAAFILDDGFQHRRARRDLDVVCLADAAFADRALPAGYLREPASAVAKRADVVLVIGAEERFEKLLAVKEKCEKTTPLCAILLQYPHSWVEARTGRASVTPPFERPVAITGIARPERFLAMLRSQSVEPSAVRNFGDHYNFKRNDIESLHNIYLDGVVTTEKDAVRLLSPEFAFLREIWYLKLGLRFADPESEARVLSKITDTVS